MITYWFNDDYAVDSYTSFKTSEQALERAVNDYASGVAIPIYIKMMTL